MSIIAYKKPIYPISVGTDYVYPITTYDQIINIDGEKVGSLADGKDVPKLYGALFKIDSWSGSGPYTQTSSLYPMDGGGAVSTRAAFVSPAMCKKYQNQDTNNGLAIALSLFNLGYTTISNINEVSTTLHEKPTVDIEVVWLITGTEPPRNGFDSVVEFNGVNEQTNQITQQTTNTAEKIRYLVDIKGKPASADKYPGAAISNILPLVGDGKTFDCKTGFYISETGRGLLSIYTDGSPLEDFKNWLKENPIIVWYNKLEEQNT